MWPLEAPRFNLGPRRHLIYSQSIYAFSRTQFISFSFNSKPEILTLQWNGKNNKTCVSCIVGIRRNRAVRAANSPTPSFAVISPNFVLTFVFLTFVVLTEQGRTPRFAVTLVPSALAVKNSVELEGKFTQMTGGWSPRRHT